MADFQITGRPQLPSAGPQRPLTLDAPAQPQGLGRGAEPANGAAGLLQGLAALNPALHRHAAMLNQEAARAAALADEQAQRDAVVAGKAAAESVTGPVQALTGQPVDLPSSVPPAYGREFRQAWGATVANRAGVELKQQALAEYGNLRNTPDFNAPSWLAEQRQKFLQGVTDPHMVAALGAHLDEMDAEVRGEAERQRRIVRDQERVSTLSVLASDSFTANMNGDQLQAAYPQFQQRARDIGFTPKEAASMAFAQLRNESAKLGGAPELFDLFDRKDPTTGQRLIDMNPELAPHIEEARQHAAATRDKHVKEAAEQSNGVALAQIDADISSNPFSVTESRLLTHFTKYGAIQSAPQYASIMHRAREAQMALSAQQQLDGLFDQGLLWTVPSGTQQQIMGRKLQPALEALVKNLEDPAAASQVGAAMMQAHSRAKATVPFEPLKNFIETNVTTMPNGAGPSPGFKAAAELYRSLSGNPQYRELYFKDDMRKVMDAFVGAVNGKSDEKSAYTAAYQSTSPEAVRAAEAFTKTPDFLKLVQKDAQNITGASWLPSWLGGDRPQNSDVVEADLHNELRQWRASNPGAPLSAAKDHLEAYTKSNWVLDKTSGAGVKVPPGVSAPAAQEAISAFSEEAAKRLDFKSRSDGDWTVQYIKTGDEGFYMAVASNGSAKEVIGNVNVQDLITKHAATKVLSPEERGQLGAMRDAMKTGAVPAVDPKLVAKATALGILTPRESKAFQEQANKVFLERLQSIPAMSFGPPSLTNLQSNPARPDMKVDNQATAKAAFELLGTPMAGKGTQHQSYAASLITMGESMALTRYADPASGAGDNIGMGYNLKANAATANEDLRRAGVPADVVQQVLDGKAELTPDQAKRLLLISLPRYEKKTRDAAEATSPGLWDKMLPQQRAVMIDVAYQVGSNDQFRQAWAALAKGDAEAFGQHTKVFYTARDGTRKEDVRRNGLRATMLAGPSYWDAAVSKYGSLPNSKLAAATLTSN